MDRDPRDEAQDPAAAGRAISREALERILEVTRQLATPFELETVLGQVIDAARAILRADRGSVFLYDPRTDELFSKVATGTRELRFPASRGIVGESQGSRARDVLVTWEEWEESRSTRA